MRFVLALLTACMLSACGLQPIYAGGGSAGVVQGLSAVQVAPIEGRSGWLVATALEDRISLSGSQATPRYRLDVQLDDSLESLGLLSDERVTRERRILRARYQLVDLSTGAILLDASAGSDAGIDVVSSDYATIAAERAALERLSQVVADQIVTRVSLALRKQD
ncbi:LPS assembly lipoprotein LptE [Citromicrobium bathyomarinum]|uniref:LPS assembly lipoprotein LptE n=1 Tax=Citromicrobium bathyomarinum TaxID=72174 RepID=UPI00315AA8E1